MEKCATLSFERQKFWSTVITIDNLLFTILIVKKINFWAQKKLAFKNDSFVNVTIKMDPIIHKDGVPFSEAQRPIIAFISWSYTLYSLNWGSWNPIRQRIADISISELSCPFIAITFVEIIFGDLENCVLGWIRRVSSFSDGNCSLWSKL